MVSVRHRMADCVLRDDPCWMKDKDRDCISSQNVSAFSIFCISEYACDCFCTDSALLAMVGGVVRLCGASQRERCCMWLKADVQESVMKEEKRGDWIVSA